MIQTISAKQTAADVAQSIGSVSGILENAQAQSARLSEKLLKTAVMEKIQDSALGSRIYLEA